MDNNMDADVVDVDMDVIDSNNSLPRKFASSGFIGNMISFLNFRSGTIFTAAMAMSIGYSFKDFVTSIVNCVIEPLIIYFINVTQLSKYYNFKSLITSSDNTLNIKQLFQTFFTWIIVVLTVYVFHKLISIPPSQVPSYRSN